MTARRTRILFTLLILSVWWNREKLFNLLRLIQDLRKSANLLKALPGPSKKDEHFIMGHMGGPLMIGENGRYDPEWFEENTVASLQEVSKSYRNEGLFRRKRICIKYHITTKLITPNYQVYGLNSSIPLNVAGIIVPTNMNVVREVLTHKSMEDFNKGFAYTIAHPLIGDSVLPTS